MKLTRQHAFVAGLLALLFLGGVVYVLNPFGTASLDPRARIWGFTLFHQSSGSMQPTVRIGDTVLASTSVYAHTPPAQGDIIVFRAPNNPDAVFLKRVAAAPGDTIEIKAGVVWVNGRAVEEPYLRPAELALPESLAFPPTKLPDDAVFVLGDDRDHSADSRQFGAVPLSSIEGKVKFIF